ncbi:MAG: electron transfer flavoprotein subunit alpha/FixB family protein [Deltaproteobacteria bacterium]|jgi:electron transfer flavoprotein alpha subunit|nr:electron transfer flavoprotein subunit alpha/FixB family protein [Deltaproteobacteria bacterium]
MSNINDYKGVFVFVQQVDGTAAGVAYELLGKGRELAGKLNAEVTVVLPGYKVGGLAAALARYGADRVILVDDPALETYMTEPYTRALTAVVNEFKPGILLCGATSIGRDLAPRVSARVRTGLTADCTALEIQEETGDLLMTRPAFGGNVMATIVCRERRPQMATVRPGVMRRLEPRAGASCPVVDFKVAGLAEGRNVEILEISKKVSAKLDIQEAKVLVAGGRGLGGPENFRLLEKLAEVLGGTLASSRACVDAGWCDKELQVGQTGKTVRPNLYIACGISGAIQHLAGMEEAEVIIAVNKDAGAPIFEVADYGVVGDVHKIVPQFIEQIKAAQAAKEQQDP